MKEIAERIAPSRIFVDTDHADRVVRFVVEQCETAQMTILDRKYRPPRFWMVGGRDLTTIGAASANGHAVGHHELLDKLLCVPHPDTIGLGAVDQWKRGALRSSD